MDTAARIGRLNLRIPATDAEAGRRIASSLVRNLADKLPNDAVRRRLGAIHVRVQMSPGTAAEHMSASTARAILSAIE